MFKRRFLPILSTKSHFQILCGHENGSRSNWKQEIQGIKLHTITNHTTKDNNTNNLLITENKSQIYQNRRLD